MKHVIILLVLMVLMCGCSGSMGEEVSRSAFFWRKETAAPSPTPLDPEAKTVDLRVGNDVISCSLSEMGVVVGSAGALAIDQKVFAAFIQRLNEHYGTPAQDAQILYSDDPAEPITFVDETAGQRIVEDTLAQALIEEADAASITVDLEPVAAGVTAKELRTKYALVAEYTTSFKGSTLSRKNRVNNMALAAQRINGVVVAPGEEFSMNKIILDRSKENGYYLAPAIRNGTYEQEYGGGVCQVSSTLFNAVMMADLPVTERHHHSWPMTYVPIGRDATISTGYKDFKFVNDTEGVYPKCTEGPRRPK